MEMRTPSASAAQSLSILASVHMQVAGRVNGGHTAFAVSSYMNFTKKYFMGIALLQSHLNSVFLYIYYV